MKKLLPALLIMLAGCLSPPEDGPIGTGGGGDASSGSGSGGTTPQSSGGVSGTGGASQSGGSSSSGGVQGSGGISSSGGSVGSGGTASGGLSGTGGLGSGGVIGSGGRGGGGGGAGGGTKGTGGAVTGSGGMLGSGGVSPGSGGKGGAGATPGSGGSTATVCTSGKTWTSGNNADMRPGNDCKSCHSFTIAGTIYPTAHEPNNCDGTAAGGLKVVVTGSDGSTVTLTPSTTSGNFYSNTQIKTPFTAKVTNSAGASRAMVASQTAGNCNSCHTQTGASAAPGRIMAP